MPKTRSRLPEVIAAPAAALLGKRWFVRSPIWVFRAHLGAIFGSRLLMLEHTGRKTGALRYAVVEVIDHPQPGTYIVAAVPWAQWYRNIQASPAVHISVGRHHRAPATARPLPIERTPMILDRYAQQYPRSWATLRPVFERYLGGALTDVPMIALELQDA